MLHDLPNELLIKIFEFDPTHRPKYKTCLQSINLIGLYPRFINFLNDVDEYVLQYNLDEPLNISRIIKEHFKESDIESLENDPLFGKPLNEYGWTKDKIKIHMQKMFSYLNETMIKVIDIGLNNIDYTKKYKWKSNRLLYSFRSNENLEKSLLDLIRICSKKIDEVAYLCIKSYDFHTNTKKSGKIYSKCVVDWWFMKIYSQMPPEVQMNDMTNEEIHIIERNIIQNIENNNFPEYYYYP